MALYHFHVSRVLRGRGQSSVESAAYRAGERLEDRYYGKIADYTAKGGVIYATFNCYVRHFTSPFKFKFTFIVSPSIWEEN